MKVTIYCGVPGSGKTTAAKRFHGWNVILLSADDEFTKPDGSYEFDVARLGKAHASCLRRYAQALSYWKDGHRVMPDVERPQVVVHNTNTSLVELAPYAALALAYDCELEVVTVLCDPQIAFERNQHGVPVDRVKAMHDALMKREMPPWWPHRYIDSEASPGLFLDCEVTSEGGRLVGPTTLGGEKP